MQLKSITFKVVFIIIQVSSSNQWKIFQLENYSTILSYSYKIECIAWGYFLDSSKFLNFQQTHEIYFYSSIWRGYYYFYISCFFKISSKQTFTSHLLLLVSLFSASIHRHQQVDDPPCHCFCIPLKREKSCDPLFDLLRDGANHARHNKCAAGQGLRELSSERCQREQSGRKDRWLDNTGRPFRDHAEKELI